MHNTLKTIFILRRQTRNIDLRSCMSCAKLQTPFLVIFSTTMHNTLKSSAVINRPGFQNIKLLLSVQLSKSGLQFLISGLLEEEVCIFSLSKLYVKMLCVSTWQIWCTVHGPDRNLLSGFQSENPYELTLFSTNNLSK